MSLELLFLGTGTSAGVPMIGCRCAVCTSNDTRDQRTRASVLITYPNSTRDSDMSEPRRILIDTAPEMRMQMIRHGIDHVDGVIYTHTHADHIFGLDDLRRINALTERPIDVYAEQDSIDTLRSMFRYIFDSQSNVNQSFVPTLVTRPLQPGVKVELHGAQWTPLRLVHGHLPVLGFRVDHRGPRGELQSLAYCTDVSGVPSETLPSLADLDVLVIDGLRYRHHPTHFTVDQALEVIHQVKPRQAYLTHIAHDIMHADLEPKLPENVAIAYDGLVVRCNRTTSKRK
ncbi:MAG: MBL fold metallo-hydrolase [Phycisphaeraceae bacterium]|nr:MBL fold metallo-hydrolase [Phycisphaeraceae bacterium]